MMKRIVFLLHFAVIALLSGCCKYDDTDIRNQITDINGRLEQLEQLCSRLNTNVDALQSIVNALQQNDYVTSVDPVKEGDDIIGYTITFSKSESITIYHGKDGASGSEGHTPQVGVSKDDDGNYYWTVDGEWLLDGDGQKIRANGTQGESGASGQDGVTPKFKIEDGYWHVSYDNGASWEQLGKASGEEGDSMFREVLDEEDSVTFVLADGTELVVPKKAEQEINVDVTEIGSSTAVFSGKLVLLSASDKEVYVVYSKDYTMEDGSTVSLRIDDKAVDGRYTVSSEVLDFDTKYYYTYSVKEDGAYSYGEVKSFRTKAALDLSASGTANCYIVSGAGAYSFSAVKGNSMEPVGQVASAEVLWESFGTDVAPEVGDLVNNVRLVGDRVAFDASDRKGNALIAARDEAGTILWSWHIWLTDQPEDQVYNNGAGTMMDRNLGATSVTPGEVGALGLMYQWGRKDPFLGAYSIHAWTIANSTLPRPSGVDSFSFYWPYVEKSTSSVGTIAYSIKHPTVFISSNDYNDDWYYTGDTTTDNARWNSNKTVYDPCPYGYRIPNKEVWSNAFGIENQFEDNDIYDDLNEGVNFGRLGNSDEKLTDTENVCWYPSAGFLSPDDSELNFVATSGYCWSSSIDMQRAYAFNYTSQGVVNTSSIRRSGATSVRCIKE